MRRAALAVLAALAGCAGPRAPDTAGTPGELEQALAGRVPGTPRRCISLSAAATPRIAGDSLLYRDGRRLWRGDAKGGCPGLAGDPLVIVEVTGGQLCEDDRFRTLERGSSIPGPYCRLGPFTPYVRAD